MSLVVSVEQVLGLVVLDGAKKGPAAIEAGCLANDAHRDGGDGAAGAGDGVALPLALAAGQSVLLDLGAMRMAYAAVALTAAAPGAELHLEYALRYQNGAPGETYGVGTTYIARAGANAFLSGDTWIAHYVTVTCAKGALTITALNFTDRRYPFAVAGSFASSSPELDTLWARAVNTLASVTDDAYGSDARERNEW